MKDWLNQCHFGNARVVLRDMISDGLKVQTIVTSPPYFGLRDYGHPDQVGLEETPAAFVATMVEIFSLARDVLRDDGTLWLNMGDSYANDTKWGGQTSGKHAQALHGNSGIGRRRTNTGLKSKNLMGIPWRVAFALQADGWYLRQEIIWNKPNALPESVKDRCTKSHEHIFMLTKAENYYFDQDAIQEDAVTPASRAPRRSHSFARKAESGAPPGQPLNHRADRKDISYEGKRNKRSVWNVPTRPYAGAHFAVFPPELIEPCILAGSPVGGIVLDPFFGSGTTGYVAQKRSRQFIGIELNADYKSLQDERLLNPPLNMEPA